MLKLRLTPYTDQTWAWAEGRYRTGDHRSQIEPYQHPMLEHVAVTDGTRTLLIVRERAAGRAAAQAEVRTILPGQFDAARELAERWPLEHVLIETAPGEPVRVTAGSCGIAPVYLAHNAETLHGSWDMADLADHATALSPREVARLLIYRPRYSTETVFTGIHRLTERATAIFGGHLHIHLPEPALHSAPRQLIEEADVLGTFVAVLDDALDARPLDPDTTVFHLTGGFDSGTVATRAAERAPGRYATSTLVITGPGRESQLRRRAQIRACVPFADKDLLVDTAEVGVLASSCARVRGELISPYEEPLHHPFTALTEQLAKDGARAVVTGLGGDEMVALSQAEHPHKVMGALNTALPWLGRRAHAALEYADDAIAPPAVVNSMTLLSLATTAPVLLRHGIWPVHPFTDPGMVQLGEWLPYDWRELKQLQRRRLAALGLGPDVTHSRTRESFAEVVEHAITTHARPLLRRMLADGSPLIDEKLVDPDGLTLALRRLETTAYREDGDSELLQVVHLDLGARAFL